MTIVKRLCFFFLLIAAGFPGVSHAQNTTVSVGFENGFIGEYANAAHLPDRIRTFSTLGINSVTISQSTNNGLFGGSQGNDYSVTVTLQLTNGTTTTFPAVVNWRDTGTGSTLHGIGLTVADGAADGTSYAAGSGLHKTYLLQTVGSSRVYSDGGNVSGNAANTGLLDALNTYRTSAPASTTPSALTSIITASQTSILADGTSTSTITVQLKDVNGLDLTTGGNAVTLSTTAGALSNVIDNNDGTYTATLTSSTSVTTATINGTVGGYTISDDATVGFTSNASISGAVKRASGVGVSGRTVILLNNSGQAVATATTGAGGAYTFANVAPGTYGIDFESTGNYKTKGKSSTGNNSSNSVRSIGVNASSTVTAVDGVVIDPAGVVYSSSARTSISNAIVSLYYNGSKVSNSWLDLTLGGGNDQTTGSDGAYTFVLNGSASSSPGSYELRVVAPSGFNNSASTVIPAGGTYTPALGGGIELIQPQSTAPTGAEATTYYLLFNFTTGANAASTSNGVSNNHIPLDPVPVISIANTTDASEPSTNGVVTVSLSAASATDTVIAYSVAGSATSGTDYTALSGTVTVAAGQTSATIGVAVMDDSLVEGAETVVVTLTSVTSGTATLSGTASALTATNSIADNDVATVSIANTTDASEPSTNGVVTV
ncbi:invasin domain 3-containing protein, partial [Sphingorhabdus sp.]|uniref:invasin domain 3-containing protein n=1 Tax=Sphingorhabdus sp. TaxID=1902408 RepID=UPI002FDD3DD8